MTMKSSYCNCSKINRAVCLEQTEGQCRDEHQCMDDAQCPLEKQFHPHNAHGLAEALNIAVGGTWYK
jgi:hypothetical protein